MRPWKAILLVSIILMGGLGFYIVRIAQRGFSARSQPSALEAAIARAARDWGIPRAAREEPNPWADAVTAGVLADARAHWSNHCATCHANDGSGNTEIGRNLYPKAPDMRLPATQNLTDGELYYIIRNGIRLTGMPAWGDPDSLQDDESWQLVLFIRHLPAMTAGESEAMKALNPRTDAEREEERQEQDFLNGGTLREQPEEHQH